MPAEKSLVSGLSGRYATALFDLAVERKSLDAVAGDIDTLDAVIKESDDFVRVLRSPLLARDTQVQAVTAVLAKAGVGDLVRQFVGTVGANRRLFALPNMIKDFRSLHAAHKGETTAEVVSAVPLAEAQVAALSSQLTEALGREVSIDTRVDAQLLGGMVVRVGSRMLDASVKTRLQSLKHAIKGS